MLEPLKGFFRGSRCGQAGGGPPVSSGGGRTAMNARGGAMEPTLSSRPSRGLEEFFTQIRDTSGLTLLDLGGATQKNIDRKSVVEGQSVDMGGRSAWSSALSSSDPPPRPSRGLEEFFTQIRDTSGLTLLDLGGATQKN